MAWHDICLGMEGLEFGSSFIFHRVPTFNKCFFLTITSIGRPFLSQIFGKRLRQALYSCTPSRKGYIYIYYIYVDIQNEPPTLGCSCMHRAPSVMRRRGASKPGKPLQLADHVPREMYRQNVRQSLTDGV